MLGLQNEREWALFCSQVLQQPALAASPDFASNSRRVQNRQALRALIVETFSKHARRHSAPVVQKVNTAFRAALKDPDFQARMKDLGAQIVPGDKHMPEGLRGGLKVETERWGPAIKSAGVYAD